MAVAHPTVGMAMTLSHLQQERDAKLANVHTSVVVGNQP